MTAIGINGFGRTGRQLLRASLGDADFKLCAINDPFLDAERIAHFIRLDTTAGRFAGRVEVKSKSCIAVDGNAIMIYGSADPLQVPWRDAGVSVVLEASGVFSTSERATAHLNGGAQRVVVCGTSPDLPVVICGVNEQEGVGAQIFCSGAPIMVALCPFLRIVQDALAAPRFTCSFVSVQPPLSAMKCTDGGGVRDLRLGRGQIGNLIPQPATGLAKMFAKALPRLAGRIGGTFVYTAQSGASLLDVTLFFDKPVAVADIVAAVGAHAKRDDLAGRIAAVETDAVVSSDFRGNPHSFVLDVGASTQITETTVKVVLWCDAESACARRVLDSLRS